MLPDPALSQRDALLGPEAAGILAAAVAPGDVEVLHARPSQVRYDPGRRIVVRYATQVRERGAPGRVDTLVAVATTGELPAGVAVLTGPEGGEVGVWRYPNDPYLPGLRSLTHPDGIAHVLRQIGVGAEDVRVQPLVYRPGHRAVLRVTAGGATLYAKVVRRSRAERVHRNHAALSPLAPVPRSVGWSAEHGLVVLEARPGVRLADPLSRECGEVPAPSALVGLLDAIADADSRGGADPRRALAAHATLLRTVVPHGSPLIDEIEAFATTVRAPADRTIHGDFYEGQLLVDGAAVTGLLDVDGVRRGSHVEDLATLVAHLDGLAHVRPAAAARIRAYRRAVEDLAAHSVDAEALRASVAGVLLGLATGPFRLQQEDWRARTSGWIALAGAWLPRRRSDEELLTAASSSPHAPAAT